MAKTPISSLQELADKQNLQLRYELLPLQNKEAQRNIYQCKLTAENIKVYGKGYSKQEAKHNAAVIALKELTDPDNSTDNQSLDVTADVYNVGNTVGLLNKFILRYNLSAPKFELVSEVGESHSKLFTIECIVGTISLQGTDTTKKKAKHVAAKQMIKLLSELKPNETTEIISFHDLISCNQSPNRVKIRDIYNDQSFRHKKKKTSHSTLVSSYPECIKSIMNEKDLSFDEVWSSYETADYNQLKYILEKLDINISVTFMQGRNNTTLAFISLDTKPDFTLVEWASTKKEALDSAVKQTVDFLKIMTQ